jgi:hypothetical protein
LSPQTAASSAGSAESIESSSAAPEAGRLSSASGCRPFWSSEPSCARSTTTGEPLLGSGTCHAAHRSARATCCSRKAVSTSLAKEIAVCSSVPMSSKCCFGRASSSRVIHVVTAAKGERDSRRVSLSLGQERVTSVIGSCTSRVLLGRKCAYLRPLCEGRTRDQALLRGPQGACVQAGMVAVQALAPSALPPLPLGWHSIPSLRRDYLKKEASSAPRLAGLRSARWRAYAVSTLQLECLVHLKGEHSTKRRAPRGLALARLGYIRLRRLRPPGLSPTRTPAGACTSAFFFPKQRKSICERPIAAEIHI